MRFVILTGLSGAGKTTALHALEDVGYFTVDNVPPALWHTLIENVKQQGYETLVVGIDIRARAFLSTVEHFHTHLKKHYTPEIIFLDASDDVLVKRYNFTRRTHPLGEAPLSQDIAKEREVLSYLRANADLLLDTSKTSAKDLTNSVQAHFSDARVFRLRFLSFGFKRGVPVDADNVYDVRFLPNPYYDLELRPIDGRDERVQNYVFTPPTLEYYSELREFIRKQAQFSQQSNRSSYTVAIGCTGGQHRSVAISERLAADLKQDFETHIEHRDVQTALAEHAHD